MTLFSSIQKQKENNGLLFLNNNLMLKMPPLINLLWKNVVDFNKMIVDTTFQK